MPLWYYDDDNQLHMIEVTDQNIDKLKWWSEWIETHKRVEETKLTVETGDKYWISTVFLSVNHQLNSNESPILWETMITKNGAWLDYLRRYMS